MPRLFRIRHGSQSQARNYWWTGAYFSTEKHIAALFPDATMATALALRLKEEENVDVHLEVATDYLTREEALDEV